MSPIILNEDVVLLCFSLMKRAKVLRNWINSWKIIEFLKMISELISSWLIGPSSDNNVKAVDTQECTPNCEP